LPALVFASQSPYTGWQNVVNSRNVRRNKKQENLGMPRVHAGQKINIEKIL
jgi:hypothetical protein